MDLSHLIATFTARAALPLGLLFLLAYNVFILRRVQHQWLLLDLMGLFAVLQLWVVPALRYHFEAMGWTLDPNNNMAVPATVYFPVVIPMVLAFVAGIRMRNVECGMRNAGRGMRVPTLRWDDKPSQPWEDKVPAMPWILMGLGLVGLLALHDLRERLSVVFQDYQRYDFTAAENIRISNIHEPLNTERLQRAAQQSGVASTIERLSSGYDTLVGHAFSGAEELSGGQWQQLAIARAFYANAEVLILDEPSSAIDPLIEQAIFEQLFAADLGRLIIFVTHRLYHLQRADRIIVMDQGRVAEQGNFAALMGKQGLFYRLFAAQQV